jgi:hypothetical protein
VTRRHAYTNIRSSNVSNPYGDGIVVIEGSQVLVAVSNTAADQSILAGLRNFTISPDSISGTLGGLADRYNKYFFTSLVFEFVPYQPNSTDGHGFAFGYNAEVPVEFTQNFADIATLAHAMVLPMTGFIGGPEMNCLAVLPSRKTNPWFWNEDDTATTAGQRQTRQGMFYGCADSAITTEKTWGTIWVHYVIEFCDLMPDQGFTMKALKRQLRESPETAARVALLLEGEALRKAPKVVCAGSDLTQTSTSISADGEFQILQRD